MKKITFIISIVLAFPLHAQNPSLPDVLLLKQKYLAEKAPKVIMKPIVDQIVRVPVGQGWNGYRPTEWYFAAELAYAAGCDGTQLLRLRQALDFAETHTVDNWWEIEVGIPRALANGLLRGGSALPEDIRIRLEAHLQNFLAQQRLGEWNGANTVYRGWTRLAAGLYFEDLALCQEAVALFATATSQGKYAHIRPDWTYFFHNDKMNMFYGSDHFIQFSEYLVFSENTTFSPTHYPNSYTPGENGIDILGQWVHQSLRWITYRGAIDPLTINKFPNKWHFGRIELGAQQLLETSYAELGPYRSDLQDIVNHSAAPIGARAFPSARYLSVRRPGYFAGLALMDLVAPHLEASSFAPIFGAIDLVTPQKAARISRSPGEDNVSTDILNVPAIMPGTLTVPAMFIPDVENPGSEHSNRAHLDEITDIARQWGFYGVTTLNGYEAMAAEYLRDSGNNFRLKKSWFFFDDEIVVLISDLKSTGSFGPPYTWLYAFKPAGSALQTSAGPKSLPVEKGNRQNLGELRWASIGDMGFHFPGPFYISAEGLGNGYTKLILDHGRSIDREKAAVVILPGAQAAEAENYHGIEILKQDSQAHIVRDRSSNVLGAAFFSGAETQYVGVNLPAYLIYKTGANQFHFTLYNPHKEQAIPIRLSHEGNPTNPMADASIDPARATHQFYQVKLPFRLQKSSGEGMALFDLQPLDNNWTLLSVNLRVYRKFELRGQKNADGSYSLDRAFIALNDAAVPEEAAPYEPVDAKPVAVANVPGNATVGKSITFDGSASYDPDGGSIQQYTWEFGDGATSHGQKVLHAYAQEGRFQGTLKVRDDQGNEDTAAFSVLVTAPVDSSTSLVVKISVDDRYELYVNGERLGSGSGWETAEAYTARLRKGKNVIAVKALNSGSAAALLAEIHAGQQQFFSSTQWKISRTMQPGWEKVDFDDRSWGPAFSYGAHGTAQPWAQFTNVQGIAIQKPQWIWSKYKSDPVVYFRFAIGGPQDRQPPAAPTGLSTRIGN